MKLSRALAAAAVFLAINLVIPASASWKASSSASHTMSGDVIQKSLRQAQQKLQADGAGKRPVVFIGSSLVIAPLWSTDVKHGFFYQDCMLHHGSQTFQNLLGTAGLNAPVVSLATAGQFVSDTYLIVDKFFNKDGTIRCVANAKNEARVNAAKTGPAGEDKPLALIYGVAPRDFMDDTTGGLALTSVFDELVELSDMPETGRLFFSTFDERADFLINRSVYLYRKRGRYQNKVQESMEKAVAKTMHDKALTASAGGAANDPLAGFLLGGNRDDIWAKSISEYSRRYKFFNRTQFEKQKECFKALISMCKDKGIKLYVVAMPITEDNRRLMPRELYAGYISCLQSTTEAAGVPFVDLQKSGQYQNQDFYDTVHLAGTGGEKFLSAMADMVVHGEQAEIARTQVGTAIAGTKKVASPAY